MFDTKNIDYYNKYSSKLIEQYNNANVKQLSKIFDKYIEVNSSVLDIGFGSGRDLNYIKNITKRIYGIEASEQFILNLQQDKFYENKLFKSVLPNIDISNFDINKFDIVITVAVLMHLNYNDLKKSIENIKKLVTSHGKVIISYSTKSRYNDERTFYEISKYEMTNLFRGFGFYEIDSILSIDGLNRDIEWVTQIYEQ